MIRKKAIVFLEIQFTSYQIADYVRKCGYTAIVLTANPGVIPNVRDPYRQFVSSLGEIFTCRSWFDHEILLSDFSAIEERYDVAGVYARSELCLEAESVLRRHLAQRFHPLSLIDVWLDKFKLRLELRAAGLSDLRVVDGSRGGAPVWPYASPFYFKPRRGTDSVAVIKCNGSYDLPNALAFWEKWLNEGDGDIVNEIYIRRSPQYYLEEMAVGEHLSIEAVVSEDVFLYLGLTKRSQYSKDNTVGLGFVYPAESKYEDEIIRKTRNILDVIGFRYGAVHLELIVSDNGNIELIDFNPRLIGSDVMRAMNICFNARIEEIMQDIALTKAIHNTKFAASCYCESRAFFLPQDVKVLESIVFPQDIRIIDSGVRTAIGTRFEPGPRYVKDIAGSFMVSGKTPEETSRIADEIQDRILVNGRPGVER